MEVPSGPLRWQVYYKKMAKFEVKDHALVPKHSKLSEADKKTLFEKYAIDVRDLPKVFLNDPAILDLDVKEGDIVKIARKSFTAGEILFYRRVVNA